MEDEVTQPMFLMNRTRRFHAKAVSVPYDLNTQEGMEKVMGNMLAEGWEPFMGVLTRGHSKDEYQVMMWFKYYCAGADKGCQLCDTDAL